MKYITFVPLIGGMAIANNNIVGHKPEFVLSYNVFEKNESNLKNYWPDVKWYLLDETTNTLSEKLDFNDIDFVSSVCPCAGMSALNMANRSADNKTNNWLYKVAEFTLSTIKPKVYWGENAPGLYSDDNEKVLNKLREYGEKYGYSFTIYKTDTTLHGIPQRRIRTFFFFWKNSNCPIINWYNHPGPPFEKYILDKNVGASCENFSEKNPAELYPEMDWIMKTYCNNSYDEYIKFFYKEFDERSIRTPYDFIRCHNLWEEYKAWLEKDSRKDKPISDQGKRTPWYYLNYRFDKVKNNLGFFAMQPQVYKGTTHAIISKNMFWTLHPVEQRFLNTREILSMMGMPSDFVLISKNLQHVTQNVPVNTAQDMTREVIKFINGELKISNSKFIKQNNIRQEIDYQELSSVKLF